MSHYLVSVHVLAQSKVVTRRFTVDAASAQEAAHVAERDAASAWGEDCEAVADRVLYLNPVLKAG